MDGRFNNMLLVTKDNLHKDNIKTHIRTSNVDYKYASNTRPLFIPELDLYTSLPLSYGNSKLHDNIAIFDLLAIYSCPNHSACANSCYAVKAQKTYPTAWNKRLLNTYLAIHNIPLLEKSIQTQLADRWIPYVRIHSSGDFINDDYTKMWIRIANALPLYRFYFYTKVQNNACIEELANLANVNKVESILPDGSLNYGSEAYIKDKADKYNITICDVTMSGTGQCGLTCTHCMTNKYVLFKKH